MMSNDLFNISESLREETGVFFLNQPPMHLGDSVCEEEIDDIENDSLPGEPFVNKLQRSYKYKNSVSIELLSTLSIDGMKHLIEILINDVLNLRNLKEGRKTPTYSDTESENYKFSNNFSTTSYSKQPTFPLSRPIAREELKMRRNNNMSTYQKVDVAVPQPEIFAISPIEVKMSKPEHYDQTVLKLYHDITEANHKKNMLYQLIRLSPNKFKISSQMAPILDAVNRHKYKYHALIQETGKKKIFSKLTSYCNRKERPSKKRHYEVKEEDKNVLKTIINAYDSQNLKNFREYAYSLMKEYEASEITALLVKYACNAELEIYGQLLFQNACMKQILDTQENMQKLLLSQNENKKKNIQILTSKLN